MPANDYPPFPQLLIRDDGNQTSNNETQANKEQAKMSGSALSSFLVACVIVAVLAGLGFAAFIFWRRRQSQQRAFGSVPGPSFAGAKQGISSLWYKIKNPRARSASAGFEGISDGRAQQHRGRALDSDEAWDTNVGAEADLYYEETEMQRTMNHHGSASTEYLGSTALGAAGSDRSGRIPVEKPFGSDDTTRNTSQNPFGDDDTTKHTSQNPFGDEHAVGGLQGISSRPVVDTRPSVRSNASTSQISPTRRSLFKEEI